MCPVRCERGVWVSEIREHTISLSSRHHHHSPHTSPGPGSGLFNIYRRRVREGAFGVFSLRLKTKSKCPAPRVRSSKLKKKKIWNWPCPELVRSKACFKHLLSLQSWRWYVKIVTAPLITATQCQAQGGYSVQRLSGTERYRAGNKGPRSFPI